MTAKNLRFLILLATIMGLFIAATQIAELLVLDGMVKLDLFLTTLISVAFLAGLMLAKFRTVEPEQTQSVNIASLTAREMDIFLMLYNGKTNKEIATAYSIELSTVKTHINNLYSKLQVTNRKEARELYRNEVLLRTPPFVHPL